MQKPINSDSLLKLHLGAYSFYKNQIFFIKINDFCPKLVMYLATQNQTKMLVYRMLNKKFTASNNVYFQVVIYGTHLYIYYSFRHCLMPCARQMMGLIGNLHYMDVFHYDSDQVMLNQTLF